jgi:hypothetical protein
MEIGHVERPGLQPIQHKLWDKGERKINQLGVTDD